MNQHGEAMNNPSVNPNFQPSAVPQYQPYYLYQGSAAPGPNPYQATQFEPHIPRVAFTQQPYQAYPMTAPPATVYMYDDEYTRRRQMEETSLLAALCAACTCCLLLPPYPLWFH